MRLMLDPSPLVRLAPQWVVYTETCPVPLRTSAGSWAGFLSGDSSITYHLSLPARQGVELRMQCIAISLEECHLNPQDCLLGKGGDWFGQYCFATLEEGDDTKLKLDTLYREDGIYGF